MALIKGTNSYATIEEADLYFLNRLDAAAYDVASEEEKTKALVTATNIIDTYEYTGQAISSTQPLAFPRIGSYYDNKLGMTVVFDSSIPSRIVTATCELAYHLLNNDGMLDDTGEVETLIIGSIELRNIKAPSKALPMILKILKPLRLSGSTFGNTGTWWRAN